MKRFVILGLACALAGATASLPALARPGGPKIVAARSSLAPAFVTGIHESPRAGSPATAALGHLRANTARYGFDAPERELRFAEVLGGSENPTVRFDQFLGRIPVFGARYLVHLEGADGGYATRAVNGHVFTELDAPTTPAFSAAVARALVRPFMRLTKVDEVESNGLTVLPEGRGILAYHFTVWGHRAGILVKQQVFVNAVTGAIALSYNDLQTDGPVIATGATAHGDNVTLEAYLRGSSYELRDRSREMFPDGQITTHDAEGRDFYLGSASNIVTSQTSTFGTSATNSGAIDAHVNAGAVYEFYRALGRDSIDGEGGSIVSSVNATEFGQPMFNAFWDGTQVVYGNPNPAELYPLSAALDVGAHELTHGVTQYSGGLIYLDQSGAMNEAYSDYFGAAIEATSTGMGADAGLIGEDLCKVPQPTDWECPLRDLNDGATTDDFVFYLSDFDSGGVHLNSTIYGGALWNIREALGATADRYIYKALTEYTTPLDDFIDGRNSVLAAAAAMGASQSDVNAINAAFDAQGIVTGWDRNEANDSTILLRDLAPVGMFYSPPQVSGSRFVVGDYGDKRDMCCSPVEIYVGNVDGSGRLKKVGEDESRFTYNDEQPDISGKRAVWAHMTLDEEGFDLDIHSRVLGRRVEDVIEAKGFQWYPSISGELVAWEDTRTGATDIWASYIGGKPFKVTGASGEQLQPQVLGDWIAWWDTGSASRRPTVGLKNVATGKSVTIRARAAGGVALLPGLGPKHVYWFEDSDGDGQLAVMRAKFNGSGKKVVVKEDSPLAPVWFGVTAPPTISANASYITYADELAYVLDFIGSGDQVPSAQIGRDVWIVSSSGGDPELVTRNRGDQAYPSLVGSGRKVVWLDSSNGRTDLMRRTP